jgi:putative oxidoreductase
VTPDPTSAATLAGEAEPREDLELIETEAQCVGQFPVEGGRDQMMRGYAQQAGFPIPGVAGWVAGLWLILGAVSVALGIWPDLGSLMIGAFVIPAALFFHRYWALEDETKMMSQTQLFYRNLVILGAAVVFFGTFITLGSELRFAITPPFFDF